MMSKQPASNTYTYLNFRKVSLVTLLSLSLFLSLNAISNESVTAQEPSALTFVSSSYRPWTFEENNQITGLLPDIVSRVAGTMGLNIELRMVPHRRVYAVTSQGMAHLQVAFIHKDKKDPHYPEELLLGTEPLFVMKGVGVALKDRKLPVSSLKEASAYRVGLLLVHPGVSDTVYANAQKQQTFHNTESLLKGLLQNRIDIALDTRSGILEAARSLGVENRLQILYEYDSPLSPVAAWSRPAVGENVDDIANRFDQTLRELKQAGKIDPILLHYGLSAIEKN